MTQELSGILGSVHTAALADVASMTFCKSSTLSLMQTAADILSHSKLSGRLRLLVSCWRHLGFVTLTHEQPDEEKPVLTEPGI